MDWAKAKSILIILFLGLNIFLTYNLVRFYKLDSVSGKNIVNTQNIMADRGYILKCKIPTDIRYRMLNYKNGEYDRLQLARVLLGVENLPSERLADGQKINNGSRELKFEKGNEFFYRNDNPSEDVYITDMKRVQKFAEESLLKLKLPISEYHLDKMESNSDGSVTLMFKEKFKQYLIFYNEVELVVTKKGITELRGRFIKPKDLETSENKIVPAYKILLKFFTEGKNTEITGIDLGFICEYTEKNTQASEGLVWRISIKGQEPRYFRASSSEEIEWH